MSDTFGLTFTRDDLIKSVLRALGVIGQTQEPSAEDYTFCSEALNLMIKSWVNKGATLWKINEIEVPMLAGLQVYPFGPTAGYVYTITVTDGGTGYTSAPVTITDTGGGTGATATATIEGGVITAITVTASGNSYTQATTTVSIGGDGSGATATAQIAGLTIDKPLRIMDNGNYIRTLSTHLDVPMTMIGQTDYNMLGNKTSGGGIPVNFFYNPLQSTGYLYVYPVPADDGQDRVVHLWPQTMYTDTTDFDSLFNFPQEFLNALKWGLAFDLLTEYGVDAQTEGRIEKRYEMYVREAFSFSAEEASTYLTYNTRQGLV